MRKKYLCGALLMLAACGTSPEPNYYMLSPVDGAIVPQVNQTLLIDRPALPDYLDRPQMVTQLGANEIEADEMHRWGAPLDTMFEDILAQDLRQRMPNATITKDDDHLAVTAPLTLDVEIDAFNRSDAGAVLAAQFSLKDNNNCMIGMPQSMPFRVTSHAGGRTDGLSDAVGQFADQVTALLAERDNADCAKIAE